MEFAAVVAVVVVVVVAFVVTNCALLVTITTTWSIIKFVSFTLAPLDTCLRIFLALYISYRISLSGQILRHLTMVNLDFGILQQYHRVNPLLKSECYDLSFIFQ